MRPKFTANNYISDDSSAKVLSERFIPLSEACRMFPNGKVSRASLERWWRTGVRGAVLQTYLIGYRRYTTLSAIRRFIEAQQSDSSTESKQFSDHTRREREIDKAEANVRRQLGEPLKD